MQNTNMSSQVTAVSRTNSNTATKAKRRPRKRKLRSLFSALCNTVGLIAIMASVVFGFLCAVGKFYDWIVPLFNKVVNYFVENSFTLVLSIALIAVLAYVLDGLIRYNRRK